MEIQIAYEDYDNSFDPYPPGDDEEDEDEVYEGPTEWAG